MTDPQDSKSIRLDQTLGSMSPEKLAATRNHITTEMKAYTGPAQSPPDSESESETPASFGSKPAPEDARLMKLDLITDVQIVLVDKYRRAAKLMWVLIFLVLGSNVALAYAILFVADVAEHFTQVVTQVTAVNSKQETMMVDQRAITKATQEMQKKVEETKKKIGELIEAAPKLEVDESGKAKISVKVKRKRPKAGDKGLGPSSHALPHPPPPPAPKRAEFSVTLK